MPVTFSILPIPLGSKLVKTIGSNDPKNLNDFSVLIVASEKTELEQSDIILSATDPDGQYTYDSSDVSIMSFAGSNSVYEMVIRPPNLRSGLNPPEDKAIVTVTIVANAVPQGNSAVSQDIRVSTAFPDDDAEVPTALFSHGLTTRHGIAATPNRLVILGNGILQKFGFDGTAYTNENEPFTVSGGHGTKLDYINGDFLMGGGNNTNVIRISRGAFARRYGFGQSLFETAITHTRLGIHKGLRYQSYDSQPNAIPTNVVLEAPNIGQQISAHQNDLIYMGHTSFSIALLGITDNDEIALISRLNIARVLRLLDITIFGDTLYFLTTSDVHTLDIRPYRPLAKNTKNTLSPIFVTEGDIIDLKQFSPDAKRIVFDVGYDQPDFLSINANSELVVASNAVTETTPVLVRCLGINYIDSQPFEFYLIIQKATNPIWRDIENLSMRANSSYDLYQIVEGADEIVFRSGRTQPAGSRISNGALQIGTVGGRVSLTARRGSRTAHKDLNISVVQESDPNNFSDIFRHRVEIAGIDVTDDVIDFPTVSKSLDVVSLNEYRANELSLSLRSGSSNNFRYNDDIPGNFWESHQLNAGGFQMPINIFIESFVNGTWISHLLFSGVINDSNAIMNNTGVMLKCVDVSTELQKTLVQDFGTLKKWDSLRPKSDEENFQNIYTPEASLLPMQTTGAKVWSDNIALTIRKLAFPSEGRPIQNAAYITPQEVHTSRGFFDEYPILNFKPLPRSEDVRYLIAQLALNKKVYNTDISLSSIELNEPYLLNRGSVPFSVENTRSTRLPVDWVYDSTHNRMLILLSNPEAHMADLLVQYDLDNDSYRILHTFSKGISVHRIARRTSTDYYILSAKAITQDRSASEVPRQSDASSYAYDSISESSEITIQRYNALTNTLTEHVGEDDNNPPQLGVHYHVGFENDFQIDTHEGIVPYDRGEFKWYSGNLYYRYATSSEFGVARVNTSGITSEMIDQAIGDYHNHLNFAFNVLGSNGTIYFVYAEADTETSTLTIKRRTSDGTETTILSETRGIGDFNEVGLDFGAFLGCYEALFHNNHLYILVPIQKIDFGDDTRSVVNPDVHIAQRTAEKSGERNVTTSTNLNPSNLTLTPGDDIPLRIDFDGTVSGATQDDLTVYGGTIESFSISSDMIDVTITPNSKTRHKTIIVDLAEDAVSQGNEAWRITIDFLTPRSRAKSAGMALYKCNVTAGSPSLTMIEKWDFVHHGGCNLIVHDDAVHLVEHPPAYTRYKPYNPDLEGYWTDAERTQTMDYNVIPDALGSLKKIKNTDELENLGNLWFEERAYNVAATRCLSFDGDLHLIMGYGNLDELLRLNSLASKPDNFQHLVYGKKLHYVVPNFDPNDNRYNLLADLAKKTNATLSFESGMIRVRDRDPFRAYTNGNTNTGTGNLNFDNANKTFPSQGYLLIEKEIIRFTGIADGAFTGIERGVLGTQIVSHPNNTKILYLDSVLDSQRIKGGPSIAMDMTRIFNAIRNSDNTVEEYDSASIKAYGELPYLLDLGLTHHENAWQEKIFENYLDNLKDPHPLVKLTLKPSFYLGLEQFVGFRYNRLVYGVQIVSITYTKTATTIQARVL